MEVREVNEAEFLRFTEVSSAANFLQSVEAYRRYKKRGQEAYLLVFYRGKQALSAGLVVAKRQIFGQKIFSMPRGFLLDFNRDNRDQIIAESTVQMRKFLKAKGGMVVFVAPNFYRELSDTKNGPEITEWVEGVDFKRKMQKNGYKYLGEYEFVKWAYVMDIDKGAPEEIFANFQENCRHSIKYATSRYGIRIREMKKGELKTMKELAGDASLRHGFLDPKLAYYEEMFDAFRGKVRFLVAEMPEQIKEGIDAGNNGEQMKELASGLKITPKTKFIPVASAMFVEYGDEITYLFSGMDNKYRKASGQYLLQWEQIQRGILNTKFKHYNFYGTKPDVSDGGYLFKRGFRGYFREYIGTFVLPLTLLGKIYAAKQKATEIGEIF